MPAEDAGRWDQRYAEEERFRTFTQPRPFLVEHARLLPKRGLALDAAMGLGGNASLLLKRGLQVIGVDISGVAVCQVHERLPELLAVQADLTSFQLAPDSVNVILNFYYLQRDLWTSYRRWLKPGGLLFIETMTRQMSKLQPDLDPAYLLEPAELSLAFSDWEILVYQEGWQKSRQGHPKAVASMIARRPV